MAGLLARTADYQPAVPPGPRPRYDRVVYLASPAARSVVDRAAANAAVSEVAERTWPTCR
jgi:hypothetical protein